MEERIYRYKLDFYYQQTLIYLLTLVLYTGVRGSFIEDKFEFVFRDPLIYVISIFVGLSFISLLLNKIRDRKIIVSERSIILKTRFHERSISLSDILWMNIGRERSMRTAGRSQVVIMKTTLRRRVFRFRLGRYEREKELLAEMKHFYERVPHKMKQKFGKRNS
ncbi:MAG: hypothetical protein AAB071_04665 [Bacteroidota bacterium]